MVNAYLPNKQQPRLENLYKIAKIPGIEVTALLIKYKLKYGQYSFEAETRSYIQVTPTTSYPIERNNPK